MATNTRRQMILSILDDNVPRNISEIMEEANISCFHNSHKYVGEILSRMVRRGMIKRVKRGVYKFKSYTPAKKVNVNPDQEEIKW